MSLRIIRSFLNFVKGTPLHPQWIALREVKQALVDVAGNSHGIVLDIGCGQQLAKQVMPEDCDYIGLDYFKTASEWYCTRPQLYGDAQQLPLQSSSINTVLLLDVLEHLPSPWSCIAEIKRVLTPTGKVIIQVPFIYPIHDAPLDFHRWTEYGLDQLFREYGLEAEEAKTIGKPIETAALLSCIALSKHVLNWIDQKNPLCLSIVLLPFAVLTINCFSWLVALLSRNDELMPAAYRYVLRNIE